MVLQVSGDERLTALSVSAETESRDLGHPTMRPSDPRSAVLQPERSRMPPNSGAVGRYKSREIGRRRGRTIQSC